MSKPTTSMQDTDVWGETRTCVLSVEVSEGFTAYLSNARQCTLDSLCRHNHTQAHTRKQYADGKWQEGEAATIRGRKMPSTGW